MLDFGDTWAPPGGIPTRDTLTGLFIPVRLRWPEQSACGDVIQILSLNAGESRQVRARASREPVDAAWLTFGLKRRDRWARDLLAALHGGLPPSDAWITEDIAPGPIVWKCGTSSEDLRLCERCFVQGYHSPLQQLPWMTHCFIHNECALIGVPPPAGAAFSDLSLMEGAWSALRQMSKVKAGAAVAARQSFPVEAASRVRRYRDFVARTREMYFPDLQQWVRWQEDPLAEQRSTLSYWQRKTRPDDAADSIIHDYAVAATILARQLGFDDLLSTVMRTPLSSVHVLSFRDQASCTYGKNNRPIGSSIRFECKHSGFEPELLSAVVLRKWTNTTWREERPKYRLIDISLCEKLTTFSSPCSPESDQRIRDNFEGIRHRIYEALRSINGCHEAMAWLEGEGEIHCGSNCIVCDSLEIWSQKIWSSLQHRYPKESVLSPSFGSMPHLRELPNDSIARDCPAFDSVRLKIQELDAMELFVAVVGIVSRRIRCEFRSRPEPFIKRAHDHFQRFLVYTRDGAVEMAYWDLPDLRSTMASASANQHQSPPAEL